MFKTPPFFWYQKNSSRSLKYLYPILWIGRLLYLFFSVQKKKRISPVTLNIPVICVGNVSLGGTGKTPTCLALYDVILEIYKEASCHFLTRGYKGSIKGPLRVKEDHNSDAVGDEALLLFQKAPTWVSRSRKAGGKKAEEAGATHLIMDDGFQNPDLFKDVSLIVVDGFFGFGNQCVFPMGPLREGLEEALGRAQGLVLIGEDTYGVQVLISRLAPTLPIIKAHFEPSLKAQQEFYKTKVIGFAGIGFPDKFYKTLQALNAEVLDFIPFPDHYKYPARVLKDLQFKAQKAGALLVTTEKDYVRLPNFFQKYVSVVPITLIFEDKIKLMKILKDHFHG